MASWRFRREAQITGATQARQHGPRVLDAPVATMAQHAMVLEYLDGQPLDRARWSSKAVCPGRMSR